MQTNSFSAINLIQSKITDLGLLVKFKLSLTVMISAALGFLIVLQHSFIWSEFWMLCSGGLLITFASNAINEVIEKDFDKLMVRTKTRPVASERMSSSEALLWAGIMCLLGALALASLNIFTAFLGVLSLVMYAFIYTPIKRISPAAVWIGAVPGALPVLIGCVAATGNIGSTAMVLFFIQFLWQFPHFWSIAWLADADYKRAGFNLLPSQNGMKNKTVGLYSFLYAFCLIPVGLLPLMVNTSSLICVCVVSLVSIFYTYKAMLFYKRSDDTSARSLMFTSFAYLPLVLLIFWLDKLFLV